jgi:hypothetical protein
MNGVDLESAVSALDLRRLAFSVVAEECFIDNMTIPETTIGIMALWGSVLCVRGAQPCCCCSGFASCMMS